MLAIEYYESILKVYSTPNIETKNLDSLINTFDLSPKEMFELKLFSNQIVNTAAVKAVSYIEKNEVLNDLTPQSIQELSNILNGQLTRIQLEYEAIQIWSAILTIIFLTFSFFSLFKADDLVQQGKEGLKDINIIKKNAKDVTEDVSKQVERTMESIKTNDRKDWHGYRRI